MANKVYTPQDIRDAMRSLKKSFDGELDGYSWSWGRERYYKGIPTYDVLVGKVGVPGSGKVIATRVPDARVPAVVAAYLNKLNTPAENKGNTMRNERRSTDDYLQEVYDSLVTVWDKNKFDMSKGYDDEYECECIKITYKDNDGVYAKIYVDDYEGKHPVAFDVVYRYPGDKGVGIMGTYEFQSTDFDETASEIFDYFDEVAKKASESLEPHIDLDRRGDAELCADDPIKLRRDINSRGYFVDDKGFYNVYVGASFKGKFASVEDAAEVGYTLVESKKCESVENAIQQFADEYGHISGNAASELLPKYRDAVKSVVGDKVIVGEPWIDDYSVEYTDWNVKLTGIDGMAPGTHMVITLCKDINDMEDGDAMDSWLVCSYRDSNYDDIAVYQGDVGAYDPFVLINKCLSYSSRAESKKCEGIATDIKNAQPKVYLVSEVAEEDLYDNYDDIIDVLEGSQSFVSVETAAGHEELPLGYDRDKNVLLIYDDDALTDDVVDTAKMLVMNFITGQSAVSEKPLTDDYVCIVDGMDYTATCYVPESNKSEGKECERKWVGSIPVYKTAVYADLDDAFDFMKDLCSNIGVTVSKTAEDSNGNMSVEVSGDDSALDAFSKLYSEGYNDVCDGCDADAMGWIDPVDLEYYTEEGRDSLRKSLYGESKKSESKKNERAYLDGSMSNAEFMSKLVDNAPNSLVFNKNNNSSKNTYTISANPDFGKSSRHALIGLNADDDKYEVYTYLYNNDAMSHPRAGKSFVFKAGSDWNTFITMVKELFGFVGDYIKRGSQTESKKSEGLPPKRLGSKRQYRSRADLINKMKQLGAVEITTSKQFNDIKNSQWLHTAGYALDTNGNLVAQSYYGDKDGKWYYTSTRNFDGDYLPESKQHENRTKEEEVTNIFKGMKEWATRWSNSDKDRKTLADNLDLEAVQENMSEIIEVLDGKFEWDGYGFKYPVAFDYSEEDDGARDEADAEQWDTCYAACEEIAKLIGIPDEGNTIGAMNEYFWEEVEQTWSSNESRTAESKKSESLSLKQKELKDMVRYGEAEDITTISDAEAKELRKKGIETVGISRGTYGMNGALLRDKDGNKYVITARSSNLFYFV